MTSTPFLPLARQLAAAIERWPIAGSFTISRGAKTEAVTVVAEVSQSGRSGRGECVPSPRYGETPEATLAALVAMQEPLARGLDRKGLQAAMPPGAARNALDCALLDLEAKAAGKRAWTLLGRPAPRRYSRPTGLVVKSRSRDREDAAVGLRATVPTLCAARRDESKRGEGNITLDIPTHMM